MNVLSRLVSSQRHYLSRTTILLVLIALVCSPSALIAATTTTFSNTGAITVSNGAPAGGNPYPSDITVSGLNGVVTAVTATLIGVQHTRPDDYDVVLVGPSSGGGQTSVILMSDTGDTNDLVSPGVNLTFQDGAGSLPDTDPLTTGTYSPTNFTSANDADEGISLLPGALASSLSVFNAANPNTTWSLYVYDDRMGSQGQVAGGWSITITINETPVANNDGPFVTAENTPVDIQASALLANDTDAETNALEAELVGNASNGNVVQVNETFTYTPNSGYSGPDSFTYRVTDGFSFSNTATVSLTVTAANGTPTVNAGSDLNGTIGVPVNLLATYTDSDVSDTHTATIDWGDGTSEAATASAGTVSGSHTYATAGIFVITVTVTDNSSTSGSDTAWATIVDPNDPSATLVAPTPIPWPTSTPLPLLASYDTAIIDDVVISDVPQEVRYGIFARLLVRDGAYLPNVHGGHIGDQGLIDRGIIHAVDITTVPGVSMAGGVSLCFNGTGDVYFLNAASAPRVGQLLDSSVVGGRTCVTIYSPGTVVMTRSQGGNVTMSAALVGCQVTTIYRQNLRAEAALDSAVLTILSENLTLTATELRDGWFHVSYETFDGWLAAEFVNANDSCVS